MRVTAVNKTDSEIGHADGVSLARHLELLYNNTIAERIFIDNTTETHINTILCI
jgi:hypothetical protein